MFTYLEAEGEETHQNCLPIPHQLWEKGTISLLSIKDPLSTSKPKQERGRGEAYVAGLTLPNLGIPLGQRPPGELWKGHTKRKCGWTCVLQLDLELMLEWLKTFREVRMR